MCRFCLPEAVPESLVKKPSTIAALGFSIYDVWLLISKA